MGRLSLIRDCGANAAVEMALVLPFLLAVLFGSVELGNLFMSQHALDKQVRDGARYGARLALTDTYDCSGGPSSVFADPDAVTHIIHVTETGAVTGTGQPRWDSSYWDRNCDNEQQTVTVSVSCVPKTDIDTENTGSTGIYTGLNGDIPVVKVAAKVRYFSVLSTLGFDATNICMQAESTAAVQGL